MPFVSLISCCSIWLLIHTTATAQTAQIHRLRQTGERLYINVDYDRAKWYYQQAYRLSIKQNQTDLAANLLVDISSVELLGGNYKEAVSLCLKGLSMLTQSGCGQDSTFFKLFSSLGSHYQQLTYYDSSAHYFAQADELLRRHPGVIDQIPDYVMYHYSNQALLHEATGRFSLSISLAQKALTMARQRRLATDVSIFCNVLAGQYERLGNYALAMNLRREGLANNHVWDLQRARIYSGIGRNAFLQKKNREALRYLHLAHQLYTQLMRKDSSQADTRTLANLFNHLGRCYVALKEYERAESWIDKAIATYTAKYGHFGKILSTSWLAKSQIKLEQGQINAALAYDRQALKAIVSSTRAGVSTAYPSPLEVLDEKAAIAVALHEGEVLTKSRQWSRARAAYQFGIAVFQQAQTQLNVLADKLYISETVIPLYRRGLDVAFQLYQQNRSQSAYATAFELMEQGRAVALQNVLAEGALQPLYIPEAQRRRERRLQQRLADLHTSWFRAPSSAEQQQLRAEETRIRLEHYHLLQTWKNKYPKYYQARYSCAPISIRQVQHQLADDQAYLHCTFQDNKLYLFAITNVNSVLKVVPIDSSRLFKTIDLLQKAVRRHPGLSRYQGTPYALQCFEWFIEPVLSQIDPKSNWIINAGNVFESLPFEVFETGRKVNDYVALQHPIFYVYTAGSFVTPVMNEPLPSDSVLAVAPFSEPIDERINKHFQYGMLAASETEINQIQAEWLSGRQATRTAFFGKAPNFPVWYLDTHAYLNAVDPMQSFITFYPTDTTYAHRLYAREISQFDLRYLKLVILSACESGSGKLYQSEGMMSLARTFAYAGCPSVISPLWNAHDRTSVYLLTRIHAYLKRGYSSSVALQKARLDFFASETTRPYNHPFFWANFRLVGIDNPPNQQIRSRVWLRTHWQVPALLIALAIFGLLLFLRHPYNHLRT